MKLSAVGSIPDMLMCKMLVNECMSGAVKEIVALKTRMGDTKDLKDSFEELYFRSLYREHLHAKKKAEDIVKQSNMMDEAKKIIGLDKKK